MAELRRAYRQKAKEFHPDNAEKSGLNPREAAERFIQVQDAYQQLLPNLRYARVPRGSQGPQDRSEDFARRPPIRDDFEPDVDEPPPDIGEWDGRFAWDLTAGEVQGLRDGPLRAVLWYSLGCGIRGVGAGGLGAKMPSASEGRERLEVALMPLLDEIVRRQLLVRYATAAGDKEEAGRLRRGRSKRHVARDAWLAACQADGKESPKAIAAKERFDVLTEARADITADEGTYPDAWDRDVKDVQDIRDARRAAKARDASFEAPKIGRTPATTGFFRLASQAARRGAEAKAAADAKAEAIAPTGRADPLDPWSSQGKV